jgi:hypothetical protein
MVVECPLCGKKLKSTQALRGHYNFYHGMAKKTKQVREIEEKIKLRQLLKMARELEHSDRRERIGPQQYISEPINIGLHPHKSSSQIVKRRNILTARVKRLQ